MYVTQISLETLANQTALQCFLKISKDGALLAFSISGSLFHKVSATVVKELALVDVRWVNLRGGGETKGTARGL